MSEDTKCKEKECRMWIDHEEEYNCSLVSIKRNGDMTLHEVADRLKISYVRVKQIQDKALKKVGKRLAVTER
jgi:DNA-directed RNA polymerase specialized sigma subunit